MAIPIEAEADAGTRRTDAGARACVYALRRAGPRFTAVFAPILPHMAEDVWQNLPYEVPEQSVFQAGWPSTSYPAADREGWMAVRSLRDLVHLSPNPEPWLRPSIPYHLLQP